MSRSPDLDRIFRPHLDGLEEYRAGAGDPFHRCFGCGPAHPDGLRVRCYRAPEGVRAPVWIERRWEGPPGAIHGGIVAAYLDEILGAAAVVGSGRLAVTGELSVRYARPVPPETPLLGRGRFVGSRGRAIDVEGHLEDLATGQVLATARGRFIALKPAGA